MYCLALTTLFITFTSAPFFNIAEAASTQPFLQRTWSTESPYMRYIQLWPTMNTNNMAILVCIFTDCGWSTDNSAEEAAGRESKAALNPGRSPATASSYNYNHGIKIKKNIRLQTLQYLLSQPPPPPLIPKRVQHHKTMQKKFNCIWNKYFNKYTVHASYIYLHTYIHIIDMLYQRCWIAS